METPKFSVSEMNTRPNSADDPKASINVGRNSHKTIEWL